LIAFDGLSANQREDSLQQDRGARTRRLAAGRTCWSCSANTDSTAWPASTTLSGMQVR